MAFDMNAVAIALKDILTGDPLLAGWTVQRSEPPPERPERTPWLGIYKKTEGYAAHTISAGNRPWRVEASLDLVLMEGSLRSGEDADSRMEAAKKALFTVLEKRENLDIAGTVLMVGGWSVDYGYGYTEARVSDETRGHFYFVEATITLTLEARA